jgi:phosphopantetheinyl transferase
MIWLASPDATAPDLPAVWLVATGARPANLAERSALRRGMARAIVARRWQAPGERIEIGHDARGRPLLVRPAGTGLHLSLATRAGLVAVALAERPVGVDVERIDHSAALPLAALHGDERQALAALEDDARPRAFALIWAAKEAYVKALGTGFQRAPESFAVRLLPGEGVEVDDPERGSPVGGATRLIKNGGQESLAAAVIVLD